MAQRHRARRRRGRAERLELILGRFHCQAIDHRDAVACQLAGQVAQHRVEAVIGLQARRNINQADQQLAGAVRGEVQPDRRDAAGDRRADVEQVGVALGARAQHRVGEGDRVRLTPGDLLAEGRAQLGLVGRAGEAGGHAHAAVGVHLPPRLFGPGRRHRPLGPAVLVHPADVRRRGHGDGRAQVGQPFGVFQRGVSHEDGAVDVGGGDVEQFAGVEDLGHAHDDPHRHPAARSAFAGEKGKVGVGEMEHGLMALCDHVEDHALCLRWQDR